MFTYCLLSKSLKIINYKQNLINPHKIPAFIIEKLIDVFI